MLIIKGGQYRNIARELIAIITQLICDSKSKSNLKRMANANTAPIIYQFEATMRIKWP